MQSIKQIQRLNESELASAVPSSASWHTDYRDTAYIYIGGLDLALSEGDVITIFSQYGDPVWIKLGRDKETGKSRGFAWLKYEDQRSCDLAVDNLAGGSVMGRLLAVDHARYERRKDEDEAEGYVGQEKLGGEEESEDEDRAERRRRKRRRTSESESEVEESRPMIKEEVELARLMEDHDDDDPMKAYMISQKKEEVEEALKAVTKGAKKRDEKGHKYSHRSHHHRHRRHGSRTADEETKDSSDGRARERRRSHRERSGSPRPEEVIAERAREERKRHARYHAQRERERGRDRDHSSNGEYESRREKSRPDSRSRDYPPRSRSPR